SPGQGLSRNSSASWWISQSADSSVASFSFRRRIPLQSNGPGVSHLEGRDGGKRSICRRPRPSHWLASFVVSSVEGLSKRVKSIPFSTRCPITAEMISSSLNAEITATTRNESVIEECTTRLNEPVSLADFTRHGLERCRAAPERLSRGAVASFSFVLLESRLSCIV